MNEDSIYKLIAKNNFPSSFSGICIIMFKYVLNVCFYVLRSVETYNKYDRRVLCTYWF